MGPLLSEKQCFSYLLSSLVSALVIVNKNILAHERSYRGITQPKQVLSSPRGGTQSSRRFNSPTWAHRVNELYECSLSNVKATFHDRGLSLRPQDGNVEDVPACSLTPGLPFPPHFPIPLFSRLTLLQGRQCCLGPSLLLWSHHLFPWAVIFLNLNQSLSVSPCG